VSLSNLDRFLVVYSTPLDSAPAARLRERFSLPIDTAPPRQPWPSAPIAGRRDGDQEGSQMEALEDKVP
jgi:hypothetical protein